METQDVIDGVEAEILKRKDLSKIQQFALMCHTKDLMNLLSVRRKPLVHIEEGRMILTWVYPSVKDHQIHVGCSLAADDDPGLTYNLSIGTRYSINIMCNGMGSMVLFNLVLEAHSLMRFLREDV